MPVAVAHEVLVPVKEQEAPVVSGRAVHGLSLAGGGGAGEQVMEIVPHAVWSERQELPDPLLRKRRME